MGFSCGIIGLPNVGKSTLFNALTETRAAQAANYPFCTIDPNEGDVAVPDPRLERLAEIGKSQKILPARIAFTDIAGLVKGASEGEGLGSRFLAHISEADALLHVLRCFDDKNVAHILETTDPVRDAEIVETELMLADMESLQRRIEKLQRKARGSGEAAKDAAADKALMEQIHAALDKGDLPALSLLAKDEKTRRRIRQMNLLTSKPVLYVCNSGEGEQAQENDNVRAVRKMAEERGAGALLLSAALEEEIASLPRQERRDYLEASGLERAALEELIRAGYALLDLITFFTVGEKETRAWTIPQGATAPEAAGRIHGDFEKGFIRAEVVDYDEFLRHKGWKGSREAGRMRLEGRDYVVRDGDVMHIRHAS